MMQIDRAIIDFSQICFAQFYGGVAKDDQLETEEDKIQFFKHRVFTKLADINKKLKCHEMILAIDSSSWRKDTFVYYKAKREADRADKSAEFNLIFKCMDAVKADLPDFNYKVVCVNKAEGDDIIAVLVDKLSADELTNKIFIVSTDKDFQQLTGKKVLLYNHLSGEVINCENKDVFLLKLIMGGDSSDGIPNILSDDDTFVNSSKRQKACGEKKMESILMEGLDVFLSKDVLAKKNFDRNKKLITLSKEFIPEHIWNNIINEYETVSKGYKRKNAIMIAHNFRLKNLNGLVSRANDFI